MLYNTNRFLSHRGWSGGAMVLGKLLVPGRPTIWITVGQGLTALAVGAGGGCLDIFTLIYPFFPLSPSLWETARYRLKYCLKGLLKPKTTNQPILSHKSCSLFFYFKANMLLELNSIVTACLTICRSLIFNFQGPVVQSIDSLTSLLKRSTG